MIQYYYIGDFPTDLTKLRQLGECTVGFLQEQRQLKDGRFIVKTPIGVEETPKILQELAFVKYSKKEFFEYLESLGE